MAIGPVLALRANLVPTRMGEACRIALNVPLTRTPHFQSVLLVQIALHALLTLQPMVQQGIQMSQAVCAKEVFIRATQARLA